MLGLVAVVSGGEFVTFDAKNIAEQIGVSEALVGLTIVAVGTSLPELITSIVALKKKETDIALGNIIGEVSAMLFGFGALIVFYCIYFVAEYLCIPALFYLTPLKYFDVYAVAKDGISLMFLLISGVITFLSIFLAKNRWAGKEM